MIPFQTLELSNDPSPIGFNNGVAINRVETLNLLGSQYATQSIDLKIAPRRGGSLGNGPYQEVECTISLAILGSSARACLINYEILMEVLHDTSRWWDGQFLNPTYLTVQVAQGGSLWRCLVYTPRGAEYANTPPEQNVPGFPGQWVIPDVQITFVRRALWLANVVNTAGTGVAAANPSIMRCSGLPDQIVPAPTEVRINNGGPAISVASPSVTYVAVASNPDAGLSLPDNIRIGIVEAENAVSLPTGVTSVADAANFASGNVLRVSIPTATSGATSVAYTISGYSRGIRAVNIWAAVRNNSTSGIWTLRTYLQTSADANAVSTVIDNTPNTPLMYNLGYFSLTSTFTGWNVLFSVTGAVGTATLDIDYFIITPAEEDGCAVYSLNDYTIGAGIVSTDPRALTATHPAVLYGVAANNLIFPLGHSGDVSIHTHSQVVDVCVFGTDGAAWRIVNATPAVAPLSASVFRRQSNLLPE